MGNTLSLLRLFGDAALPTIVYLSSITMACVVGYFMGMQKNPKSICAPPNSIQSIPQQLAIDSEYISFSTDVEVLNDGELVLVESVAVENRSYPNNATLPTCVSWSLLNLETESTRSVVGIDSILDTLRSFEVDPTRGFLPCQDPLQRLPSKVYQVWEELADDLPKLLTARLGQAREPLRSLPELAVDGLQSTAELRRAHLLLSMFAHAYVWGGPSPLPRIPRGIAVPLCEVSRRLDLPPVLCYPSIVLSNWRRLDRSAVISMDNLCTLNNFFGGKDESWFYLITVEIEAKGAAAIVPILLALDAVARFRSRDSSLAGGASSGNGEDGDVGSEVGDGLDSGSDSDGSGSGVEFDLDSDGDGDEAMDAVRGPVAGGRASLGGALRRGVSAEETEQARAEMTDAVTSMELCGVLSSVRVALFVSAQLKTVSSAIRSVCASLATMREGCHPLIFFQRVRPFLAAWKQNPTVPDGVVYEGVQEAPMSFFGGSAAQSSLLPCLDIFLGVSHEGTKGKPGNFLAQMRAYMPAPHRRFLEHLEGLPSVRDFVMDCSSCTPPLPTEVVLELRASYDSCVEALQAFRTGHISLVADYIMAQQSKDGPAAASSTASSSSSAKSGAALGNTAGGKGTGGTELMKFLKPLRDDVREVLLDPVTAVQPPVDDRPTPLPLPYYRYKDHVVPEDIDLYRGAAHYHMEPIRWTAPMSSRESDLSN